MGFAKKATSFHSSGNDPEVSSGKAAPGVGSELPSHGDDSQQTVGLRPYPASDACPDRSRSRSWTGKPCRMLRNEWTEAWERPDTPDPLGMPLQYLLTSEAQHRIRVSGKEELLGIPDRIVEHGKPLQKVMTETPQPAMKLPT